MVVLHGRDRVHEFTGDIIKVFGKWQRFFNPVMLTFMRPFMKKADLGAMRDFILPITQEMIENREKGVDYLFYGAPAALLFHQSPYADPVDGHIACTYAMIAAESLGLGDLHDRDRILRAGEAGKDLKRNGKFRLKTRSPWR